MTECQRRLLLASEALGLKVSIPFEVKTRSGIVYAEALFLQLGGKLGHLIFHDPGVVRQVRQEIYDLGYSISVFDDSPEDEPFHLSDYVELFSDWGWNSEQKKPAWFLD